MDIIEKLKASGLCGRGGAAFPVWQKWEMILKHPGKKYIVCNGAEGEPGVAKDHFILKNHPETIIEGIKIALKTFDESEAIIYLRADYYQEFKKLLEKLIAGEKIKLFQKRGGYLAGEETTLTSVIEGGRVEPKVRPPYPCDVGIHGLPTLINNLETFYHIAKIAYDQYKKTRFYTISGAVRYPGVYELGEDLTIKQILRDTKNQPVRRSFWFWQKPINDFFVQSGGGMSGEILLPGELEQKVRGQGAIVVYDRKKINPKTLMKKWIDFFYQENCDKCVPCREGVLRIREMIDSGKLDRKILDDLFLAMEKTSFCALGQAVVVPFKSFFEKVYPVK